MTEQQARVLEAVQEGFPIEPRPYRRLAQELEMTEQEVICTLASLRREGVLRDLSPVFDPAKLGYCTTLVGMKVGEERIPEVASFLSTLPEVTHNYLRDHEYNMWFTVVAAGPEGVERVIDRIEQEVGCWPMRQLPQQRAFKVRAVFEVRAE